ncbi:hypothetical protein [Solicola sp. PLA-1-18]|uniref:hypothetical protein n=1 Tax=Solicola sp. PLA-1-18 TaxID=3380532 RepID=UPI003B79BB76
MARETTTTDRVFDAVCGRVLAEHPEDDEGLMLRSPGLKGPAGRFYAFVAGDGVIVKLPAPRVAELIETGAGEPCSPSGRRMREWVRVPAPDEETCLAHVLAARAFVVG